MLPVTPSPVRGFWRSGRPSPAAKNLPVPPPPTPPSAGQTGNTDTIGLRAALKEQEARNLGELNECLAVLAAIFPDVQPQVFREMLQTFAPESRLELITEAMLKHRVKWMRGRWRVPKATSAASNDEGGRARASGLPQTEHFRTMEYKMAVKLALYEEFKGLSHSTIKGMLAEHNYCYSEARDALLEEVTTSWRFSIAKFIFRRKVPTPEQHPFLRWRATRTATATEPYILQTGSEELDEELQNLLVRPVLAESVTKQLNIDRELAFKVNEQEAEDEEATFDCECCFTSSTFEEIATCDDGHYICFRCIRHTMTEALYGQGWAKAFDAQKCSLKCIALAGQDTCPGSIRLDLVERALSQEANHEETLRRFHQRASNENILKSQLQVRQCPSCSYAEVEEPPKKTSDHDKVIRMLTTAITFFSLLVPLVFDLALFQLVCAYIVLGLGLRHLTIHDQLPQLLALHLPKVPAEPPPLSNGQKFICRSPTCALTVCLRCNAPWTDPHTCYTSTRASLLTHLEAALSNSIKRTCPRCSLSFIKASGCNKLVCVCGYAMCYVCRADIGKEGYMHFCQHFRSEPGSKCTECERCDLYLEEEEGVVVERARRKAVKEWREMQMVGGGGVAGLEEVEREVLGAKGLGSIVS